MNDKIADMLIQIKNAGSAGKQSVALPYSRVRFAIAQALLRKGYIASVSQKGKKERQLIEIGVAYKKDGTPRVGSVSRVSKLSRRVYYGLRDIRPVRNGYGLLVLSTPKGIISGDEARKEQVGGEALFKIW